jgi:Tfp pilus assembly protein PilF
MSVHPTCMSTRMRAPARRLLACLGVIGALCAAGPAHAQGDAKAALIEQGNYWQSMGRADLAEESWRKLLRVDPQSADAMYGMSQVELARGNTEPARSWIARLRAAHPDDARAARLQQQSQQPGTPQTDLQRARAAAQAGRTAEALALYRTIFDNRPPPEPLAVEYYQLLGGTPQGWEEGRKGLEQLTKDKPDNLAYQLALAQLQSYREPTRREAIRKLAELEKKPAVATGARASWRQALIWLDARAADAALYQDYLGTQADPAVQARLDSLTPSRATAVAPAVAPAAEPRGEGFKSLDRGDLAVAEQRFQQALRLQPGDAESLGGMGLIRLRQERFAQAQELLTQASKTGGRKWASALQSATYWNLIGQANAARDKGDLQGSRSLLERAVKIDPNESVGQTALAGSLPDQRVEEARARARAQVEAGDAAGAQRTLEDAMLAAPDSPWIRLDLANIYRRQGLMAQARGVMDGLLLSRPDMPDALFASALLASDAGDPAAGLQYLDRIPAAARTRDMTQLQRRLWAAAQTQQAQALVRQGQPAAARAVLAQTEATLGADMPAELWGQLASAYAEIGDAPRALAMSRQLLTRSPNPGIGDRLLYASILLKTQQDVELSAVLRQLQNANMTAAQRGDFDSLRIAFSLRQTDALREAGNLEAAYNAMAPVLAERPNDPQVLAALARLYSAARDERQALALYQRILQRSPTDLDTLVAAAASASALSDHGNAESYVQAALKQAPDQSRVLAAAGRVYRNAGDNGRAEQYLRAAVAADSRAARGPERTWAQAGAMPAANPFAGMTGGAPSAALPVGAAYPAGYPPAPAGVPSSPFAGMRGNSPAATAMPPIAGPVPAAYVDAASFPSANQPWASGNTAAPPSNESARVAARGTPAARQRAAANAKTQQAGGPAAGQFPPPAGPAPQFAQAPVYPLPAPAGQFPYPMPAARPGSTGSAAAADNSGWIGQSRQGAPAANPLLTELQDLEAERSTTLTAGTVYRSRAGEQGLSQLSDLQIPIEARIPAGSGKIVFGATPTVLDSGTMAPDYGTTSRFGGGPQAALNQSTGRVPAQGTQHSTGIGLNAGYEGKNLNANIGTTPLGFQEANLIGNVTYNGSITDSVSFKADLSRRAVTDSLLSFAGTEDTRTGDRWGGVVASGGRLDLTRDDGTYGLYGYGSAHSLTGRNVASNTRVEGGGGMYVHLLSRPGSSLTVGMNLDLLRYDKNLSYFTFGQGGYFSPQSYVSVALPVDWSGRDDRLSWRVNASLGVQSFTEDPSPYFPTDPARQAGAAGFANSATALGLNNAPFTGFYTGSSRTGFAYNLAALFEYQLAPQLYLGGSLGLNNASNYRQVTGSTYLRYMFGNSGRLGGASGGTPTGAPLRPMTSPYTPLL